MILNSAQPKAAKLEDFKIGDRVRINTCRNPQDKEVVPYLITDKPILQGHERVYPRFYNATGTVIKVHCTDSVKKSGMYGFVRVKFDTYQYGFKTCEFPLYEDGLVVKVSKFGTEVFGAYTISKI